jgi:hypothetical protein
MVKRIVGIVSLVGLIGYAVGFVSLCNSSLFDNGNARAAFLGPLVGAGIWIILGRRLNFFSVFEHELTHLIFSLVMFQKPRSFYASERRGHVTCARGNFIDGLAPYYFPTFSYLMLAFYPLLKPAAHPYFFPVLGFTTGYHIVSNIAEFKPRESDIRRHGVAFSLVFCLFAGALTVGFLLGFVRGGLGGGLDFIAAGWREVGALMLALLRWLWSFLSGLL